nr:hypothetical protein [Pandoravirus belohorizontensis]
MGWDEDEAPETGVPFSSALASLFVSARGICCGGVPFLVVVASLLSSACGLRRDLYSGHLGRTLHDLVVTKSFFSFPRTKGRRPALQAWCKMAIAQKNRKGSAPSEKSGR